MVNPAELVEALVARLRAIPELVAEMDGDAERIYAYHDHYPKRISLSSAVYEAPHPSILVAWQRTSPGFFGRHEVWKHDFALYLRARETSEVPPTAYYRLWELIVNGVPEGDSVRLLNATIHPACYPMDVPTCARLTDEQGVEHFVVNLSLRELGDA
ncbi:MAG: hypothetical protein ACUVT2_10030 [Thiobacillaceae bacterium]